MINDTYVPGAGPLGAKLCIVGEGPSYEEINQRRCFVGPSGRELDSLLRDAGINRSDCWITNVSKYFVPPPPRGKNIPFWVRAREAGVDIQQQINELRTELVSIQPNCILALGGTALWALTGIRSKPRKKAEQEGNHLPYGGISDYRGSILLGMSGHKVVATYHPAHLLHQAGGEIKGYWNRQVMIFDFKRALAQSKFKELNRPYRNLHICQNSGELHDFIQRNKSFRHPSVDIEAHPNGSCIPICIGLSFKPHEGITAPLWNIDGLSNIPDSDLVSIWRQLAHVLYDDVVGQNIGYDRDKIKRLGFIFKSIKSDTMLKAFAINPELPKNLAFNTSIYTEEPYYKHEGMYDGKLSDLLLGCARDACVTKEIDITMDTDIDELGVRDYYEQFLLPLQELYAGIESEGFRVDHDARRLLVKKYIEWDERIRYDLFRLCGAEINTSSPKQVASLMYGSWKIPQRAGTGEEIITALLNGPVRDPSKRRGLELILEDRRVKKTLGTYLLGLPDFDGRMRTSFFLCLDTGRSSTNQQEPPIRPSFEIRDEKNHKKRKVMGFAPQTLTKHGEIGPEIRTQYIADDGYIFLNIDSSQAEARVIFMLADDQQALKDIDEHDYHALTASWFFGGTESDYSKKVLGYESPIRFAGKTLRHAGHLGAGKSRAAIEVNTQARRAKIDFMISESEAGKALEIFHRKQPKIKGVFHAGVIECLKKHRRLSAPVPYGINAKIGGTRIFFERWGDDLFRGAFSYLPQRIVSENTKGAALRIKGRANWIKIVMESHDALLLQVPISRKMEAITIAKEEMERPIDFSTCSLERGKLVIPSEAEEGYNYYDLHKISTD